MDAAVGEKADRIRGKFNFIVSNNPAIETISKICLILSGEHTQCDIPPNLIPYYKFAPLTSVDVERSFSLYKSILTDTRTNFSLDNLEKYIICNFNNE